MSTNNGGPAFPITAEQSLNGICPEMGMTLRDYFAAKVMEGELATMGDSNGIDIEVSDFVLENTCKHWYRIADAMLKARNK